MTNEKQEESGPVTVQIAVCSICHALFMLSGDRLTSPCHGADPLAVLATLTIGSDDEIGGVWGSHAPRPLITREQAIAHLEALGHSREEAEKTLGPEEPRPASAPPEEPPAEDAAEAAPAEEVDNVEVFLEGAKGFLSSAGPTADDLHGWLTRMGSPPEDAANAVGRLDAVRVLLQSLEPPREAVPVAPAPPEAESSPENT